MMSVIYDEYPKYAHYAECRGAIPGKPLKPSVLFARAPLSQAIAKIRLGWKGLTRADTHSLFGPFVSYKEKSFIELAPRVFINLLFLH